MPLQGNPLATAFSTINKQTITGNGTVGPYTLDYAAGSDQDVEVFVNNVRQEPGVAYTVAGTSMTMTGVVQSSDDFYVLFQGKAQQTVVPGPNTITAAMLQSGAVPDAITKATSDPTVSTNGTQGDLYLNKTSGEMWCLTDATAGSNVWTNIGDGSGQVGPTLEYLVVAGGGGGGASGNGSGGGAGGGGAGGMLTGTPFLPSPGTVLTITVGSGGAGGTGDTGGGTAGNNSSITGSGFTTVTASGGGGGAGGATSGSDGNEAEDGGSGGGSARGRTPAGSGTTGQGNDGGLSNYNSPNYPGGGGGGKGAAGADATTSSGGNGGNGGSSSITGSAVTYAGGGGGGTYNVGTVGTGGTGGGGDAGTGGGGAGNAGTDGLGGGGGGASMPNSPTSYSGGDGGDGVAILKVPTANYSGTTTGSPTITTSGTDTIIKYTSSGTYTA